MSMILFYYWFKDENGVTHRVPRDSYCGDVGDPINHMGHTYVITDWIVENHDRR